MQKAAKEKVLKLIFAIASVLFLCAPSTASSTSTSGLENRVELFLLGGENRTEPQAFGTANRVENYDSFWGTALESSVAPNPGASRSLPILDNGFTPDIDKLNFGKHLRLNRGGPGAIPDPHAHHILFKKGLGPAQQRLVSEGQEILWRHNLDPIGGLENLVWAPMRVKRQHGIDALQNVVDTLKRVDSFGGSQDDIIKALRELGAQAARRR